MHKNKIKLTILVIAFSLSTLMCSSGYITPDSLTATAVEDDQSTLIPTAFFSSLTPTPSQVSLITITPSALIESALTLSITPTPVTPTPTTLGDDQLQPIVYLAQSGDSMAALSARFGVNPFEIVSAQALPETGFISPGQLLVIPQRLTLTSSDKMLLPDSEIIFSNSATDFDIDGYITIQNGFLSTYRRFLSSTGMNSGAQIIEKVAIDNSINPRLLIGVLEYESNWLLGKPENFSDHDYPMGYVNSSKKGLYKQLSWAVNQLSAGYYGWRDGTLTSVTLKDGSSVRLHPTLNAGSAALHYLFSKMYNLEDYYQAVDTENGFVSKYESLFGSYQVRALDVEPLIRGELVQPQITLPFLIGQNWYYTGGPHGAWESIGSLASIDFAPGSNEPGCAPSDNWIISPASGVIARVGVGLIILDLDFDGNEQTGWSILFLHLSKTDKIVAGKIVEEGELLGNPSCEGGPSTGTHIHIARKYNGEWMAADGPVPFELSGWKVQKGDVIYKGYLVRDDEIIESCTCGSFATKILRSKNDPY